MLKFEHWDTKEKVIQIHTDICGPFSYCSKGGAKYFVTFVVASSPFCEVALLKARSDMAEKLFNFIAWLERNTSVTVKRIHRKTQKSTLGLTENCQKKV